MTEHVTNASSCLNKCKWYLQPLPKCLSIEPQWSNLGFILFPFLESPCKGNPLDFVFIIDSSRSVRPDDYEKVKTFIINILRFLDVGPDATRVGLIQYGSIVQNEFSLNTFKKKADVENAVRNMIHLASGTMTGLAIQYTMNVAFSKAEGARPLDMHIPRIAMIVTDGRPQDMVTEVSAKARESGIQMFAIGVGRVDMSTLRAIGSDPHDNYVFLVANFSQIETLTSVFQSKLCGGPNLCAVIDHHCEHLCFNTPGSYMCRCRKGYTLNLDRKTCKAQDLCAVEDHGCEHYCVNVPGSHECRCRAGYQLNEDKKTCSRMDYCDLGNHGCEHDCLSTGTSYICRCQRGFILNTDGKTCRSTFPCSHTLWQSHKALPGIGVTTFSLITGEDICAMGLHGCDHECVNIEDSYICRCSKSYLLNPDRKTCRDHIRIYLKILRKCFRLNVHSGVDHCAVNGHGCEHLCLNTDESFICQCYEGYILNDDLKSCNRMDYCAVNANGCEHFCVNTDKSYVCQCFEGYMLNDDGKTCRILFWSIESSSTWSQSLPHAFWQTLAEILCEFCHSPIKATFVKHPGYCCSIHSVCTVSPSSWKTVTPLYILKQIFNEMLKCADGVIDLVFVIDGSKSLGPSNFELVKKFVNGIVESLEISHMATHVGLLQYSTKVRTEFTLAQHSSSEEVKKAVAQMQYMGRGSMTGSALRHMFENSFTTTEGARPPSAKVPKVSIVFTDGRSQDDVLEWATKAQEAGIAMYAVGVGKAIEDELREIASEPDDKHLYYAEDFTNMGEIANKLMSQICEGTNAKRS
ncbi:MATN2 protein, partial [Amia calva]|nr:MATN2 protein [Amia calva]